MTRVPLPAVRGGYRLISEDPAWQYDNATGGRSKVGDVYESTMSTEEICELPVPSLAAPKSMLILWTTGSFLADAFRVMARQGFTYKACGIWVKARHTEKRMILNWGMGSYIRYAHEFFLVGSRGGLVPKSKPLGVIVAPRREHSRKPDEIYELCEKLVPGGPYLEMFARHRRDGWDAWGNEID